MQLIFDCETTAEINTKMATIDEPSVRGNGNDIQNLSADINNGNKENIQAKENAIKTQDCKGIGNEKEDVNMDIDDFHHTNIGSDSDMKDLGHVNGNQIADSTSNTDNHEACEHNHACEQNATSNMDSKEEYNSDKQNDISKETKTLNELNVNEEKSCSLLTVNDNNNEFNESNAAQNKTLNNDDDSKLSIVIPKHTKIRENIPSNTSIETKNENDCVIDDSTKLMNETQNLFSNHTCNSDVNGMDHTNKNVNNTSTESVTFPVDDAKESNQMSTNTAEQLKLENLINNVDATLTTDNESVAPNEKSNLDKDLISFNNENTKHDENIISSKEVNNIAEEKDEKEVNCTNLNISVSSTLIDTVSIEKESPKVKPSENDTLSLSDCFDNNTLKCNTDTMKGDDIEDIHEKESSTVQEESNLLQPIRSQESTLQNSIDSIDCDKEVTFQESTVDALILAESTSDETSNIEKVAISETTVQTLIEDKLIVQESFVKDFSVEETKIQDSLTFQESTVHALSLAESTSDETSNIEKVAISETTVQTLIEDKLIVQESFVKELSVEDTKIQDSSIQTSLEKDLKDEILIVDEPLVNHKIIIQESSVEEMPVEETSSQECSVQESLGSDLKVAELIEQDSLNDNSTNDKTIKESSVQDSGKEKSTIEELIVEKTAVQNSLVQEIVVEAITVSESMAPKPSTEGLVQETVDQKATVQKSLQEPSLKVISIKESSVQETNSQCSIVEVSLEQEIINLPIDSESKVQNVVDESDVSKLIESNENKRKREEEILDVPKKLCKLSNTLDIFSDDEDDKKVEPKDVVPIETAKQCINIEDDDDIMVIDEETTNKNVENNEYKTMRITKTKDSEKALKEDICNTVIDKCEENTPKIKTEITTENPTKDEPAIVDALVTSEVPTVEAKHTPKEEPLLEENFMKSHKKNLADMSRDELEEFCILKIVESVVDRSCLNEIKSKLKTMAQSIDEYKKKAHMLTRQNRDLQVVLKSVQEDQKKQSGNVVTPLKITRSVGVQVIFNLDKSGIRRKPPTNNNTNNKSNLAPATQSSKANKLPEKPGLNQIPVPRLIPANNPATKAINVSLQNGASSVTNKISNTPLNVSKPSPPKSSEKRPFSKTQSVTVDLTDDEPPSKQAPRSSPAPPPVRLVSPQNLLAPQRQPFAQSINSPRKVYIPIGGPQNQGIRPGQTIMLKTVPAAPRQRFQPPHLARLSQNPVRMQRLQSRHPAPLPDAMKQYQPPNWKSLPPAPDLKLSKVENGIVISWKIDGYQEDAYEEIASYQLYAYQENSLPPSTTLWKKIGDVKALPLPMACTLTQFMAGFKYYFAVRAVDIRSRLGPFSLPGSILLLNKM